MEPEPIVFAKCPRCGSSDDLTTSEPRHFYCEACKVWFESDDWPPPTRCGGCI